MLCGSLVGEEFGEEWIDAEGWDSDVSVFKATEVRLMLRNLAVQRVALT